MFIEFLLYELSDVIMDFFLMDFIWLWIIFSLI